ncbi:hypothetical protein EXIGLDRAFT_405389 [Exidia glandulosa HHB12029]|uniref:Uncharacterized protein n=1 Tax=Exidia glandulosa HHB12029 TaxID=1314781 RepID=A0A165KT09_EXIGL|nr:hypothetical protein EXIGLDRAFT_183521 [Exidia glandulosa HHB12029]KZV96836.1 hypothetical protein EXIGLDRAFT_405389 [Exidia glandulosa HHB12029]
MTRRCIRPHTTCRRRQRALHDMDNEHKYLSPPLEARRTVARLVLVESRGCLSRARQLPPERTRATAINIPPALDVYRP